MSKNDLANLEKKVTLLTIEVENLSQQQDMFNKRQQKLLMSLVPMGTILPWYNSKAIIPEGWHICDGTNGTPDLHNKFLMGTSTVLSVGEADGANYIELSETGGHALNIAEMPPHSHPVRTGTYDPPGATNRNELGQERNRDRNQTEPSGTVGGGQPHSHSIPGFDNRPAYVSVVFIMKIKDVEFEDIK